MAVCLVLVGACNGGSGGGGDAGGPDGGSCAFAWMYTIIDGGGLVPVLDTVILTPPAQFQYLRQTFNPNDTISCNPALPPCSDATRVDVADVEGALAHPDVQSAFGFATPPIYGDRGIADGPSFNLWNTNGRGFTAGIACDVPSATCSPIPPGVTAAMQVIRALIDQQLADPTCDQLR
jgi:hypothetical protein